MRKIYVILAAVTGMTLVSCTNQEYLGEVGTTAQETEGLEAINFGTITQGMTRSDLTGDDAAGKLNSEFKVYGVKSDRDDATKYNAVFTGFTIKYDKTQASHSEYYNGWYYVGVNGQTLRYWDYASARYHFVAASPVANFLATFNGTGDIAAATVTGLGGRLKHDVTVANDKTAVYIADPVVMTKPTGGAKYDEVKFTFHSMQSKVRVGIYETIPGYKITSIQFYNNAGTTPSNYITLNCVTDNYFQGGSSVEGTVTYNWTTPGYTFTYSTEDGKKPTLGKYWEGGQFTSGVPATTSAATDLYGSETSMGTDGYFIVMPTPSATAAAPLTLKCDYVLKSLDNVDEIHVTGATATIPADYTKWNLNTAYTYLFKISDNTNGSTGDPDEDPAGLYPITFDAAVVNIAEQNVGTETTFSTPSITVYQNGDVVANGITYKTGTVTVKAYEGTTDVTSTATWSYTTIDTSTTPYDYSKDYEHLGASGAATSWTSGALTSVTTGNTYVIKAETTTGTAYFVLVVGAAENGPTNS